MKRLLKIGIGPVCAMLVIFSLNATLIASAAAYPKNMEELAEEQGENPAAVKDVINEAVSIGMAGYIVPLSVTDTPDPKPEPKPDPKPDPKPEPKPDPKTNPSVTAIVKVPTVMPKTGDNSNMELFAIAALSSLLLFLCLWAKKEKWDETQIQES